MKRAFLVLLILMLSITFTGCSSKETSNPVEVDNSIQEDNQQANKNQEEENKEQVKTVPKFIAPLTGLPAEEDLSKQRIIGIMVENHFAARPQTGLNQADMVYEVLAEGMITRFVAIYQSQKPEVIGPVRSIRPYFLDLINGYDAIIVHAGGSEDAYAIIRNNPLPDLDEIKNAGEAFWRVDFREMPHNLYTSIEKVTDAAKRRNFREDGYVPTYLFLKDNAEIKGNVAKKINIEYYSKYKVKYEYDESTKLYKRFINGEPHTDRETKEQLTAKNVMVIRADHRLTNDYLKHKEINVYGPGKGYLFQNGVEREITWERKDGVIRPFIDGVEQALLPGQTWIIITSNDTDVSYE